MSKSVEDLKNTIEGFRNTEDRLQTLTNIHKSITVSASINEVMTRILSIENTNTLTNVELSDVLNSYVDGLQIYIMMIDKITSILEERVKSIEPKKTMAI